MLYMIVERFRNGNALPVYQRFRDRGRLAPDGLKYISSFVSADLRTCYQLMECDRPALIEQWIASWLDLVEFDVVPVVTSAQAYEAILPRLGQAKP